MRIKKKAKFSSCGNYRYGLWRKWDKSKGFMVCIGVNPSTADAEKDDSTIRKLIKIAKHNGFGGVYIVNLFAIISADISILKSGKDLQKNNDNYLERLKYRPNIVLMWGRSDMARERAKEILWKFPKARCFGQNLNGSPKHPLMLSYLTPIVKFRKELYA